MIMDPCPFVRLLVGNLAVRFSGGNPPPLTSSSCYCKIKLKNLPTQILDCTSTTTQETACFTFKKSDFHKLNGGFKIEVYSGRREGTLICGVGSGKLLGVVSVALDSKLKLIDDDSNNCNWGVLQNGWVGLRSKKSSSAQQQLQLHLNVWVEPDPRFVFEFDDEPECSPQVFQVNGSLRQAVFSCNFRCGGKERKGWSVTIHDLSGSPVAMASMVTPFVPSHGSLHVRRSNPGAWLILRPAHTTWKPWGRLEAWRDSSADIAYRFDLLPDAALDPITLSNSTISSKHGGKFTIDVASNGASPMTTPTGSFDSGSDIWSSGSWAHLLYQGFVMSSKVAVGGGNNSRPEVEIGAQHVTCTEDAAAFVALAAAVDLSVDACQPFSRKLRKELRHEENSHRQRK